MIKATSGSLFNRSLVHPDYQRLRAAPRLGLQLRSENRGPRRLRDQLHLLQPRGKRAGRHQRSAGPVRRDQPVDSRGRPGARQLPHHPEQLHHRHRQSGQLQSGQFQRRLHSAQHQMAVHPELVLLGAARTRHGTRWWRSPTTAITACGCRSSPITTRLLRTLPAERSAYKRACRFRRSGPSPGWIRPATTTTTAFRRAWSTASRTACTS